MKKGIYVVRDTLAGEYVGSPLFFAHDAAAIRFFSDACADKNTYLHKYPADHVLVCLGSIDPESGDAECERPARVVVSGATVLAVQVEA